MLVERRKPGVSAMSCVVSMPSERKRPGVDAGLCLHQVALMYSHHPGGGGSVLEVKLNKSLQYAFNFQVYRPVRRQRAAQATEMQRFSYVAGYPGPQSLVEPIVPVQ